MCTLTTCALEYISCSIAICQLIWDEAKLNLCQMRKTGNFIVEQAHAKQVVSVHVFLVVDGH